MLPFSQKTLTLLERAGWTEDRRIDTQDYEVVFRRNGYPIIPEVMDFLSRFGGLEVYHPDIYGREDGNMFRFDPLRHRWVWSKDDLVELTYRAGALLCPIGQCDAGYMDMFMSADGSIYAIFDETLVQVGNSIVDSIENLCTNKPEPRYIP